MSRWNSIELARAWHWSDTAPVDVLTVDDDDLPERLIACGRWAAAHVDIGGRGKISELTCEDNRSYLAFDPDSPYGRLYFVLSPEIEELAIRWYDADRELDLGALAARAGGRQQGGYPRVGVCPVGRISQIEYYAKKYGQGAQDGATFYHKHDRRPLPVLAVDAGGRLWYAGGDYDARDTRGIVG